MDRDQQVVILHVHPLRLFLQLTTPMPFLLKRGGHGHGSNTKENVPSSLADVVRMSPSPAPGLLRKGLMKSRSYAGSRENSAAASGIPAPEHIPWLETGEKANQAYLRARQDAFKHGGLRNKFLQR